MSDHPAFYTAQPWGYRILGPTIVSFVPGEGGFPLVAQVAIVVSALLLFFFLRRVGCREPVAILGVLLFALSRPVTEGLVNPYLSEPVTSAAENAFLLAVASGAGLGVLALLGVVAALAKEILVVLFPLVFFTRVRRRGWARALADAALVALPAFLVSALMRLYWTPQLVHVYPMPEASVLGELLKRLRQGETGILLFGLTPLALVGACFRRSRRYLSEYGYLVPTLLILPFVAWVYDPRPGRTPFFGATVARLLIYVIPILLPLAGFVLDRFLSTMEAPTAGPEPRPALNAVCLVAAAFLAAVPLWGMDRYRRVDLNRGAFYGPVVRAVCHKTLKAASRLAAGQSVSYFGRDLEQPQIRWFLRDGFGAYPYTTRGDVVVQEREATILLPCLVPEDLTLRLALSAPGTSPFAVAFGLNGARLGEATVSGDRGEFSFLVPRESLFRGDNVLTVSSGEGAGHLLLLGLVLAPPERR
jgi:hypothetical protein